MFIGHYALGFAGKKVSNGPSLGIMFIAVQWLDLIWPPLVIAGIEKVSIDPGNTEMTPLNFESYPWSHSLLMAVTWGILFGVIYFAFTKNRKGAWLFFFLVFSHWILDYLTHRPDLPITPFSEMKVGLGLWNHKWLTLVIELVLFIGSAFIYMNITSPKNKTGKWALLSLLLFLILIHLMNAFGPPPPDANMVAWAGLSQWLIVAWGFWIDKNRK